MTRDDAIRSFCIMAELVSDVFNESGYECFCPGRKNPTETVPEEIVRFIQNAVSAKVEEERKIQEVQKKLDRVGNS